MDFFRNVFESYIRKNENTHLVDTPKYRVKQQGKLDQMGIYFPEKSVCRVYEPLSVFLIVLLLHSFKKP